MASELFISRQSSHGAVREQHGMPVLVVAEHAAIAVIRYVFEGSLS
jgi:hypothetical protein